MEALATYLVSLTSDTSISLTNQQAARIIELWNQLDSYDKKPTKVSPRYRTQATGRFKSPKKTKHCCPRSRKYQEVISLF